MPMTEAELSTKLTEAETTITTLTKRVEDAEFAVVVGKLDTDDQTVFSALSEPEQVAYRAADEATRENILAKARNIINKQGDEVVMPAEVKKQFEDLEKRAKAAEDRIAVAEGIAKKATDAQQMTELIKRADDEFAGLPGTSLEKALVLKSMAGMTPEEKTAMETMLKAGNACLTGLTKPVGKEASGTAADGSAWTKIDNLAKKMAVEKSIGHAEAVTKVLEANPDLYEEYIKTEQR